MKIDKKRIRVVGAAILNNGKILVAQRPYSDKKYKSLKWEFSGSKIEFGESEEDAIKREIQEELGCQIEVDGLLHEMEHVYSDFILRMTICICHLSGISIPKCLEHNSIAWLSPADLACLDWAADARCYPVLLDYLRRNRED